MKKIITLVLLTSALLSGCAPKIYPYKVTFVNGDVEYFELKYKPKPDCTFIEYEGDTIMGVKSVERID